MKRGLTAYWFQLEKELRCAEIAIVSKGRLSELETALREADTELAANGTKSKRVRDMVNRHEGLLGKTTD